MIVVRNLHGCRNRTRVGKTARHRTGFLNRVRISLTNIGLRIIDTLKYDCFVRIHRLRIERFAVRILQNEVVTLVFLPIATDQNLLCFKRHIARSRIGVYNLAVFCIFGRYVERTVTIIGN